MNGRVKIEFVRPQHLSRSLVYWLPLDIGGPGEVRWNESIHTPKDGVLVDVASQTSPDRAIHRQENSTNYLGFLTPSPLSEELRPG